MSTHCAKILSLFREANGREISNKELNNLVGWRFTARIHNLSKQGVVFERFSGRFNENDPKWMYYYKMVKDNTNLVIENGHIVEKGKQLAIHTVSKGKAETEVLDFETLRNRESSFWSTLKTVLGFGTR